MLWGDKWDRGRWYTDDTTNFKMPRTNGDKLAKKIVTLGFALSYSRVNLTFLNTLGLFVQLTVGNQLKIKWPKFQKFEKFSQKTSREVRALWPKPIILNARELCLWSQTQSARNFYCIANSMGWEQTTDDISIPKSLHSWLLNEFFHATATHVAPEEVNIQPLEPWVGLYYFTACWGMEYPVTMSQCSHTWGAIGGLLSTFAILLRYQYSTVSKRH